MKNTCCLLADVNIQGSGTRGFSLTNAHSLVLESLGLFFTKGRLSEPKKLQGGKKIKYRSISGIWILQNLDLYSSILDSHMENFCILCSTVWNAGDTEMSKVSHWFCILYLWEFSGFMTEKSIFILVICVRKNFGWLLPTVKRFWSLKELILRRERGVNFGSRYGMVQFTPVT